MNEHEQKAKPIIRVTPEDVAAEIVSEHYFTASQGARMAKEDEHKVAIEGHVNTILYPAIKAALQTLGTPGADTPPHVAKAHDLLYRAFWSETPDPKATEQIDREAFAAELGELLN